MARYDIAIIGSGPAGISAALTAKARNKNFIFFGKKELSKKVKDAHQINNYPGLPAISGSDFFKAFDDHLKQMDIEIDERQVATIYAMGDFFNIQAGDEMVEASTVILATGVAQSSSIAGEDNFLGRGVSYCATCDGSFYKEKTIAVLGYNEEAAEETEFLTEFASKIYYIPSRNAGIPSGDKIEIIDEVPKEIKGNMKADVVVTDKGEYNVDGVFIIRNAVAPDKLVPGLKVENGHVVVDLDMKTNLPGLFACGDVAGQPYQYVKSAGQGNVAALSAVSYLAKK